MNTNLIGQWQNQYGSILDIQSQDSTGILSGVYTSSTGSSGIFLMNGYSPDNSVGNQTITFAVYWKATDGGVADPTWNWVSAMGGVMLLDTPDQIPVIQVVNNMTASIAYPAIEVSRPGDYIETLIFIKVTTSKSKSSMRNTPAIKAGTITLTNIDVDSIYQSIQFFYLDDGTCNGTANIAGEVIQIIGVIDPAPANNFQSLALTGMLTTDRLYSFGLAGLINLSAETAKLNLNEADAVTYPNKYTSVASSQERFMVSII